MNGSLGRLQVTCPVLLRLTRSLRRRNTLLRQKKFLPPYLKPLYYPLRLPRRGMKPQRLPQRHTKQVQTPLQDTRHPCDRPYQPPFPPPPRSSVFSFPFLLRRLQPRLFFPRISYFDTVPPRVQSHGFRILCSMALYAHLDPREPGRTTPGLLQADQALEVGGLSRYYCTEEQHCG